mmetsp:Transcript_7108/g.17231  ORF Transcript_7108/g.17231 Transcript_7108/m.17231 type:complete len:229 (-) Transcript_7108:321-1007(-)
MHMVAHRAARRKLRRHERNPRRFRGLFPERHVRLVHLPHFCLRKLHRLPEVFHVPTTDAQRERLLGLVGAADALPPQPRLAAVVAKGRQLLPNPPRNLDHPGADAELLLVLDPDLQPARELLAPRREVGSLHRKVTVVLAVHCLCQHAHFRFQFRARHHEERALQPAQTPPIQILPGRHRVAQAEEGHRRRILCKQRNVGNIPVPTEHPANVVFRKLVRERQSTNVDL